MEDGQPPDRLTDSVTANHPELIMQQRRCRNVRLFSMPSKSVQSQRGLPRRRCFGSSFLLLIAPPLNIRSSMRTEGRTPLSPFKRVQGPLALDDFIHNKCGSGQFEQEKSCHGGCDEHSRIRGTWLSFGRRGQWNACAKE